MAEKTKPQASAYAYVSLAERIRAEWKIYIVALVFAVVASAIGQIAVPVGPGQLILFPIFYSLIPGILSGPSVAKIFKSREVKAASKLVIVAVCPFIAKLGINAGAALDTVVSAGPALFSHAVGDILTIVIALPVALALGLKREAIGAASSINRETNLAVTTDVFGAESPEARGVGSRRAGTRGARAHAARYPRASGGRHGASRLGGRRHTRRHRLLCGRLDRTRGVGASPRGAHRPWRGRHRGRGQRPSHQRRPA